MKIELERFAGLGFNDARILVSVDIETRLFKVEFEAAGDAVDKASVDGRFCIEGWEHLLVETVGREPTVIVDPASVPTPDFIFDHETVGHTLILHGLTAEPKETKWRFEAFSDFQLTVTRRSVWREDNANGQRVEVPLREELSHDEFAGRLVMIETPDMGSVRLEQAYARDCVRDALEHGEFASVPGVLESWLVDKDGSGDVSAQLDLSRKMWSSVADATVVYTDFGETQQMQDRMLQASRESRPLRFRRLFEPNEAQRFMELHTSDASDGGSELSD